MTDAQLKQQQIGIERARIEAQQQTEGAKLMAKTYADRDKTKAQHQSEGFRTMADVDKHRRQLELQRELAQNQAQQRSQPKKKGD